MLLSIPGEITKSIGLKVSTQKAFFKRVFFEIPLANTGSLVGFNFFFKFLFMLYSKENVKENKFNQPGAEANPVLSKPVRKQVALTL